MPTERKISIDSGKTLIIPKLDSVSRARENLNNRTDLKQTNTFKMVSKILRKPLGEMVQHLNSYKNITQFEELMRNRLGGLAVDPGLAQEHTFIPPASGKNSTQLELKAEKVYGLNRSGFTHLVKQYIEDPESQKKLKIIPLDIAGLREADLAVDIQGNSSADFILNQVAQKIDEVVSYYNEKFTNINLIWGRYGGDEFTIAVKDYSNESEISHIQNLLEREIQTVTGYYKTANGLEQRATKLKPNLDPISFPTKPLDKIIFQHFFNNGLILDYKEINSIYAKFISSKRTQNTDEEVELKRYLNEIYSKNLYPAGVETDQQKMKFLISKKLSLASIFMDCIKNNKENLSSLIEEIEALLFDPLLKEYIQTDTQFKYDLLKGDTQRVIQLDMKFTKEINDDMGLVYGDKGIIEFWDEIKKRLDASGLKYPNIYRKGSTFSLRFDSSWTEDEIKKVNTALNLQSLNLFEGDKDLQIPGVPIGKIEIDTHSMFKFDETTKNQIQKGEISKEARDSFDSFKTLTKDKMNLDWHSKVFQHLNIIYNKPMMFPRILKFYDKFFDGKRRAERCSLALEILTNDKQMDFRNLTQFDSIKETLEASLKAG